MLRAILGRYIKRFERTFRYDASYMHELLEVSPTAVLQFGVVASLGHRKDAPADALAAAGLVGTLQEDCGPCTQIGVDLARKNGVPAEVLRAIVLGDEAAMSEAARLAWRFARASLARSPEADPLRDEVVARWGKPGLVAIALALTTSRMYPTLKYALGHGKACSKVLVPGLEPVVLRALPA
jgi:hypothetical protein